VTDGLSADSSMASLAASPNRRTTTTQTTTAPKGHPEPLSTLNSSSSSSFHCSSLHSFSSCSASSSPLSASVCYYKWALDASSTLCIANNVYYSLVINWLGRNSSIHRCLSVRLIDVDSFSGIVPSLQYHSNYFYF
jgi:hypothetical protein